MALQIQTNPQQLHTGTNTAAQVTPQNQTFKTTQGPSHVTKGMKERAEMAKLYIESKYNKKSKEENERKDAWDMLEQKMNLLSLSEREKDLIKQDILHKEAELNRRA